MKVQCAPCAMCGLGSTGKIEGSLFHGDKRSFTRRNPNADRKPVTMHYCDEHKVVLRNMVSSDPYWLLKGHKFLLPCQTCSDCSNLAVSLRVGRLKETQNNIRIFKSCTLHEKATATFLASKGREWLALYEITTEGVSRQLCDGTVGVELEDGKIQVVDNLDPTRDPSNELWGYKHVTNMYAHVGMEVSLYWQSQAGWADYHRNYPKRYRGLVTRVDQRRVCIDVLNHDGTVRREIRCLPYFQENHIGQTSSISKKDVEGWGEVEEWVDIKGKPLKPLTPPEWFNR